MYEIHAGKNDFWLNGPIEIRYLEAGRSVIHFDDMHQSMSIDATHFRVELLSNDPVIQQIQMDNAKQEPYACECGKRFESFRELSIHDIIEHGPGGYDCDCGRRFADLKDLNDHLLTDCEVVNQLIGEEVVSSWPIIRRSAQ